MSTYVRKFVINNIVENLKKPTKGPFGKFVLSYLTQLSPNRTETAIRMCDLQPHHNVLEVGFGAGLGLAKAYETIKDGSGTLYGLDYSEYVVNEARKKFKEELASKKLVILHGDVTAIPLETDSVDRIYHCNVYGWWPSLVPSALELYRVLKPGGLMVATFSLEGLMRVEPDYLKGMHFSSPLKYTDCLEKCGFQNVHLEQVVDPTSDTRTFGVLAHVSEKSYDTRSMQDIDFKDKKETLEEFKRDLEILQRKYPWTNHYDMDLKNISSFVTRMMDLLFKGLK